MQASPVIRLPRNRQWRKKVRARTTSPKNKAVNQVRCKASPQETGCDGLMIGRGARGNPWLFSQILEYLEAGDYNAALTMQQVKEMILRHGKMQLACKGEYTGIREMRKHVAWYTSGFPHSAALRNEVNKVETFEELCILMERFS